jgi:hypothetical protein
MSEYGGKFDSAARRFQVLEAEHDKIHPDRSECGGIGGCSLMLAAHDLKTEMIDAINEWRLR